MRRISTDVGLFRRELRHSMKQYFRGVCATRQLAKRQITWLRSWDNLTWLDSENVEHAIETLSNAIASD